MALATFVSHHRYRSSIFRIHQRHNEPEVIPDGLAVDDQRRRSSPAWAYIQRVSTRANWSSSTALRIGEGLGRPRIVAETFLPLNGQVTQAGRQTRGGEVGFPSSLGNQDAGLVDDELRKFAAHLSIPSQIEISRFGMPDGTGSEQQGDPLVTATNNLVERAALGMTGAKIVLGVEEVVEAHASDFLDDDVCGKSGAPKDRRGQVQWLSSHEKRWGSSRFKFRKISNSHPHSEIPNTSKVPCSPTIIPPKPLDSNAGIV